MKAKDIVARLEAVFAEDSLLSVAADLETADEWVVSPAALMFASQVCRGLADAWAAGGGQIEAEKADRLQATMLPLLKAVAAAVSDGHDLTRQLGPMNALASAWRDIDL